MPADVLNDDRWAEGELKALVPFRDEGDLIPTVRFLGLWDAVGSFFVPFDFRLFDLQRAGFGFQLGVPRIVQRCSHAMSLDERRKSFRHVRVDPDARVAHDLLDQKRRRNDLASLAGLALVVVLLGPAALGWSIGEWPHTVAVAVLAVLFAAATVAHLQIEQGMYSVDRRAHGVVATSGLYFGVLYATLRLTTGSTPGWLPLVVVVTTTLVSTASLSFWSVVRFTEFGIGPVVRSAASATLRPASSPRSGRFTHVTRLIIWSMYPFRVVAGIVGLIAALPFALSHRRATRSRRFGLTIDRGLALFAPNASLDAIADLAEEVSTNAPEIAEVWFRGTHSDIGGSGTVALGQISARWMEQQAELVSPPSKIRAWPHGVAEDSHVDHTGSLDFLVAPPRPILPQDLIHSSVQPTDGASETLIARLRFRLAHGPRRSYPARALPATAVVDSGYRVVDGQRNAWWGSDTAAIWSASLGNQLLDAGRPADAISHLSMAADAATRIHGPTNGLAVSAAYKLIVAHTRAKDHHGALSVYRERLQQLADNDDDEQSLRSVLLVNAARMALERDEDEHARELVAEASAQLEAGHVDGAGVELDIRELEERVLLKGRHRESGRIESGALQLAVRLAGEAEGDPDAVVELLQRGLRHAERLDLGPEATIPARGHLTKVLLDAHRHVDAVSHMERLVDDLQSIHGPNSADALTAGSILGALYVDMDHPEAAIETLESTRQRLDPTDTTHSELLDVCVANLAVAYAETQQHEAAIDVLDRHFRHLGELGDEAFIPSLATQLMRAEITASAGKIEEARHYVTTVNATALSRLHPDDPFFEEVRAVRQSVDELAAQDGGPTHAPATAGPYPHDGFTRNC